MSKPDSVSITVRYLGVVRLMSGRREDVIKLAGPVCVADVLSHLQKLLTPEVYQELTRQTLLLSTLPDVPGTVLAMPADRNKIIPNGYCLTVVTPVTGG